MSLYWPNLNSYELGRENKISFFSIIFIFLFNPFSQLPFLSLASQKQAATNASVTWKPVTPIENWPPTRLGVFEEGKIYQIPHLNVAHLAECTEKPLLFRHETLRLFRSLTTCYNQPLKSKGMVVNGPPGIGKSCTTWAWVLSQLIQHDQSKQTNQNRQSTRNTNKRLKSNDEQQTVNQSSQTRVSIES